jgi:hypothetical protein
MAGVSLKNIRPGNAFIGQQRPSSGSTRESCALPADLGHSQQMAGFSG